MSVAVLYLTDRSARHRQAALEAAPEVLTITMLWAAQREAVLTQIEQAEILISERLGAIDGEIIRAGTKLRLIQRLGQLTHDIDLATAQALGVPVCRWPLPGPGAVADQMMWQMLALLRRAHEVEFVAQAAADWGPSDRTDENTFHVNWSQRTNLRTLQGSTVGILGFGEIGAEIARRLMGFGCHLLYNKRTRLPATAEAELNLHYVQKSTLYARSDVLCNLLPYSDETDMMLDSSVFEQMKPTALLVSAGSGSVIDEAALVAALRQNRLGGAALDTFEYEPLLPQNPLLPLARDPLQNVILTPHTAAVHEGPSGRVDEYENIRRLLHSRELLHRVV